MGLTEGLSIETTLGNLHAELDDPYGTRDQIIHISIRHLMQEYRKQREAFADYRKQNGWRKVDGKLPTRKEAGTEEILTIDKLECSEILWRQPDKDEWLRSNGCSAEPSRFRWWKPLTIPTEDQ